MIIGIATVLAMVASVSVFANVNGDEYDGHKHESSTIHVTSQGAHCRGTVGCNCPGFSPVTSGDVWQQAYCKHCGHKKTFH